jgi:hypothetical protein
MRYIATLASTIVVLAAGSAQAATLSTPLVGAGTGRVIQCIATNVGRTPATVAVKLYDASGNELVPTSDSCAAMSPIAANASCAVQPPPNQPASCVVQSSGKLRAALEVFDGAGIVAAVPASAR